MRYFYGKLIKATDTPTRMNDDTPYNFTVVAFSSKKLRSEATNFAFEQDWNILSTLKKSLYSIDFIEDVEGRGCHYFDSIEEFTTFFNE